MHRRIFTPLLVTTFLTTLTGASDAAERQVSGGCAALTSAVRDIGERALEAGAPGLIVAVQLPSGPALIEAFGRADLEQDAAMEADSVFRIASLTKQFTAALVLDLVEEGELQLDAAAMTYLPEHEWLGGITVRQLLIQTSGLPDYAPHLPQAGGGARPRSSAEMLEWIGQLAAAPDFSPGERWAYSNSNYAVLGGVVERVSGRPFAEVLHDRILQPAGLSATAVDDPRDLVDDRVRGYSARSRRPLEIANADWIHPSVPGPAGSLRSTASDLLKWQTALFSGDLLEVGSIETLTSPGRLRDGRTTRSGMPQAWQEGLNSDYAMGLFVSNSPMGLKIWHGGDIEGFSLWLAHYPQAGATIAILQNGDFLDLDHAAVESGILRSCEFGAGKDSAGA